MLTSLQSDFKKRIRLSLIIDLANDSIGSSECRDSTTDSNFGVVELENYCIHRNLYKYVIQQFLVSYNIIQFQTCSSLHS